MLLKASTGKKKHLDFGYEKWKPYLNLSNIKQYIDLFFTYVYLPPYMWLVMMPIDNTGAFKCIAIT